MAGRFCSLDQTHSECERNLVEIIIQVQILSSNSIENSPKKSSPKIKGYLSLKSSEGQKNKIKRSSPQFGTMAHSAGIRDLLVLTGTFSSDYPVLKSRWGEAKSRWGDADSQWGDASPLQFKYWLRYSCKGVDKCRLRRKNIGPNPKSGLKPKPGPKKPEIRLSLKKCITLLLVYV